MTREDLCDGAVSPQDRPTASRPEVSVESAVFPVVHTPYDYDKRI
jgi:hypothetical protein